MKIALIGGTGKLGRALAIAFSDKNNVIIGSRIKEKAELVARELSLSGKKISGGTNKEACRDADLVIISVPYSGMKQIVREIYDEVKDKIVVSCIVPVERKGKNFIYCSESSAAEELALELKDSNVCSGFHTIPYTALTKKEGGIKLDVLVASDRVESYNIVSSLIESTGMMNPVYTGPLFTSRYIEGLTVLLLNISRVGSIKSPTVKIIPGH